MAVQGDDDGDVVAVDGDGNCCSLIVNAVGVEPHWHADVDAIVDV